MNYYYLITSLPELSLELPLPPVDVESTLAFINRNLSEEDLETSKYLLYINDNKNLANCILANYHDIKVAAYITPSVFNGELILDNLMKGKLEHAPEYMLRYISKYKDKLDLLRPSRIEEYLWLEYYQDLKSLDNTFIDEYYKFDKILRQIATVRNSQIYDEAPLSEFVDDTVNRHLGISKPESVLVKTYPFVSSLWNALDSQEPQTIEKTMDYLRWKFIDEYDLYENFSSNQVFGWIIKLIHFERWARLSTEMGKARFQDLCNQALMTSGISELETL